MDIDTITAEVTKPGEMPACASCRYWSRGQDPRPEMNGTGHCRRFPATIQKFGNSTCGEHSDLQATQASLYLENLTAVMVRQLDERGREIDRQILEAAGATPRPASIRDRFTGKAKS